MFIHCLKYLKCQAFRLPDTTEISYDRRFSPKHNLNKLCSNLLSLHSILAKSLLFAINNNNASILYKKAAMQ